MTAKLDNGRKHHMEPEGQPTYRELEQRIQQLEKEVLDFIAKASELNQKHKTNEYSHLRRTISLMNINDELQKEIKAIKQPDREVPEMISQGLAARIEALSCVYDIPNFSDSGEFSQDSILQAIVDFIPRAIRDPKIIWARLVFGNHEVKTKNFVDSRWKFSRRITINNKSIVTLEICTLQENHKICKGQLPIEANRTIDAIAETIANIIEREEVEAQIKAHQDLVAALIEKIKIRDHLI